MHACTSCLVPRNANWATIHWLVIFWCNTFVNNLSLPTPLSQLPTVLWILVALMHPGLHTPPYLQPMGVACMMLKHLHVLMQEVYNTSLTFLKHERHIHTYIHTDMDLFFIQIIQFLVHMMYKGRLPSRNKRPCKKFILSLWEETWCLDMFWWTLVFLA